MWSFSHLCEKVSKLSFFLHFSVHVDNRSFLGVRPSSAGQLIIHIIHSNDDEMPRTGFMR